MESNFSPTTNFALSGSAIAMTAVTCTVNSHSVHLSFKN